MNNYKEGFKAGQQISSVILWLGILAIGVMGSIFAFRTIVNLVDDRTIVKRVNVCIPRLEPGGPELNPNDLQIEGDVYLL